MRQDKWGNENCPNNYNIYDGPGPLTKRTVTKLPHAFLPSVNKGPNLTPIACGDDSCTLCLVDGYTIKIRRKIFKKYVSLVRWLLLNKTANECKRMKRK